MFLKLFGRKQKNNEIHSSGGQQGAEEMGVDLQMNYCPSCGEEYRKEISECYSCHVPLISGEEKLALVRKKRQLFEDRSMELSNTDELISLRKGPLKEMKSLQRLLSKERIPAILAGDENSCAKGCCGPEMYLQVKKDDLQPAHEILARDFIKNTDLDSHDLSTAHAVYDHQAKEVVCPACGCRFSPTVGACPECGLCFE